MYPEGLLMAIRREDYAPMDRAVIARVVLNALFDPTQYPVDLSEVEALTDSGYALTRSFLNFCAINPWSYGSGDQEMHTAWKRLLIEAQNECARKDERRNRTYGDGQAPNASE